jgi:hypothetical protein
MVLLNVRKLQRQPLNTKAQRAGYTRKYNLEQLRLAADTAPVVSQVGSEC